MTAVRKRLPSPAATLKLVSVAGKKKAPKKKAEPDAATRKADTLDKLASIERWVRHTRAAVEGADDPGKVWKHVIDIYERAWAPFWKSRSNLQLTVLKFIHGHAALVRRRDETMADALDEAIAGLDEAIRATDEAIPALAKKARAPLRKAPRHVWEKAISAADQVAPGRPKKGQPSGSKWAALHDLLKHLGLEPATEGAVEALWNSHLRRLKRRQ